MNITGARHNPIFSGRSQGPVRKTPIPGNGARNIMRVKIQNHRRPAILQIANGHPCAGNREVIGRDAQFASVPNPPAIRQGDLRRVVIHNQCNFGCISEVAGLISPMYLQGIRSILKSYRIPRVRPDFARRQWNRLPDG